MPCSIISWSSDSPLHQRDVGYVWSLSKPAWCSNPPFIVHQSFLMLSILAVNIFASCFQVQLNLIFFSKTRQLAIATGLDQFRYSGTTTGLLNTGPNRSTTQKKQVQTSCDRSFVVKFIVPNKNNITSHELHIWIDILIPCRLFKVSINFVKIWLRYGKNGRDIRLSCV